MSKTIVPDLTGAVMTKIKAKKVTMRPKLYFLLGSLFMGMGVAVIAFLAVIFVSMSIYHLRRFGPFGFLWFGQFGWRPFITTVPWLWVVLAIGFVLVGLGLLKRYDFSYHHSVLGIAGGFVVSIMILGIVIDCGGVHERLEHRPELRVIYQPRFRSNDWMIGEVVIASPSSFVVMTPDRERFDVYYSRETFLPFGAKFIPGERVRMVGRFSNGIFEAKGIGIGGMK